MFGLALLVQVWALYVPSAPSVDTGLPLDKVVHAALFALVTWLGLRLGYRWIIPAMVAQAALSELVQSWFLPQRSGDIADLLADLLGIDLPETRDFATAAGFALSVLKKLPHEGEHFHEQGWRFEVVDMDGRKIDKLLASREAGAGEAE